MLKKTLFPLFVLAVFANLAAANSRPNIILIMADDMGYGDPSYVSENVLRTDGTDHPDQGWIQTPNMDAMAAAGVRFSRFYSASAVCSPTRASCLTGRNPFRVGIPYANQGRIGADETPLSKVLAAEGYATGHFGKWHLGTMTTLRNDANRGRPGNTGEYSAPWHFDYDACFATESKVPTYHAYRRTNNSLDLPTAFTIDPVIGYKITDSKFYGTYFWKIPENPETAAEGLVARLDEVNSDPVGGDASVGDGDASKLITDEAITFIQQAVSEDKPFFVVLWYHTPHKPLVDPDGVSGVDSSDAAKDGIEDLDTAIGDLRANLTTLGVRDDTMLWLTSDNGPEDGVNSPNEIDTARSVRSGGLRARKRSFYEGGIRVPGILEWPNGITNPGRSTAFLSSTSDYYTTILDYLNLSVPGQKALDGISLRPVIDDLSQSRTTPIGFRISNESIRETWIAQDYKLINAGEWTLYDMTLPDHQLELTPLATASNLATKPQAVQDVFNDMLADYQTWKASVDADTAYVSSAVPTATLSTTTSDVEGVFDLIITFSSPVSGLALSDFTISGGIPLELKGSGSSYTLSISPTRISDVTVSLPEGAAFATSGHAGAASNELTVTVLNQFTPSEETTEVPVGSLTYTTVDSENFSPANRDNNVSKFSDAPAPFATDLYVRGNSSLPARRVRALLQFDVSGITAGDFERATLHLRGYALNDSNSANLQAVAAAADWTTTPTYTVASQRSAVDGGDLIAGVDSSLSRDYELDITEMLVAWVNGDWVNHGMILQLNNQSLNNGLGIQLAGENAPRLLLHNEVSVGLVDSQLLLQQDNVESTQILSLTYLVQPNTNYDLQKRLELTTGEWLTYEQLSSDTSFLNIPVTIDADTEPSAFYQLLQTPSN